MAKETIKKNDILLMVLFMILAVLCWCLPLVLPMKGDAYVSVQVEGEEVMQISLEEDQVLEINQTNQIEISGGKVRMIDATCPDQICVHHRAISKNQESIVCLPNQVILIIESFEAADYDAATN